MNIDTLQDEIEQEFEMFDEWMQKYEHLIALGKELPLIDAQFKDDDHLIKGCQSRVWLQAELEHDRVRFTADSDAIITKGIISLLVRVLDNQHPDDILSADLAFIDRIGLKEHLSPTRANGLLSMVKQMKFYALGFKSKLEQS
jgi:cysteine desulfuration protein SufE